MGDNDVGLVFNSSPNDKILDAIKLKAFAENKINVAQMMISVFHRVENIVGKGENAGYQHFLLFPQCIQKACFLWLLGISYHIIFLPIWKASANSKSQALDVRRWSYM